MERYIYIDSDTNSDTSDSFLILTSPTEERGPVPPPYSPLPPPTNSVVAMLNGASTQNHQIRRAVFTISVDTPVSSTVGSEIPSLVASESSSPRQSAPVSPTLVSDKEVDTEPKENTEDSNVHGVPKNSTSLVEASVPTIVSFTAATTVLAFSASTLSDFYHHFSLLL